MSLGGCCLWQGLWKEHEMSLGITSWSGSFEGVSDLHAGLRRGARVAVCEGRTRLVSDCQVRVQLSRVRLQLLCAP